MLFLFIKPWPALLTASREPPPAFPLQPAAPPRVCGPTHLSEIGARGSLLSPIARPASSAPLPWVAVRRPPKPLIS